MSGPIQKVETPMNDDFWGEPIYEYSRKQAIADGVLVDVSIMAQEAGITLPDDDLDDDGEIGDDIS